MKMVVVFKNDVQQRRKGRRERIKAGRKPESRQGRKEGKITEGRKTKKRSMF